MARRQTEDPEPSPGMKFHRTGFRFVIPSQYLEQGGFPGSVGTDETDPLSDMEFKRHVFKEWGGIVPARNVRARQQQHGLSLAGGKKSVRQLL